MKHFLSLFLSVVFTVNANVPVKPDCLVSAYQGAELLKGSNIRINQQVFKWDDKKNNTFKARLNDPSLKETLSIPYSFGPAPKHLPKNHDPGRFRHQGFLKAVYGNNRKTIKKNLRRIKWPFVKGQTLMFNQNNQAYTKLKNVISHLKKLPKNYHPYLRNIGGTFSYRTIAGTKRLSAHSYGIAIDINVKRADYWRFTKSNLKDKPIPYKNRVPMAIVNAFEKEGFIWGGRWYHYDTMHFEYRPEFLLCNKQ